MTLMLRNLAWVGFLTAVLSLPAAVAAPANHDIEQLMQWWSGEFDNFRQVATQSGGVFAERKYAPYFRIHGVYQHVNVPLLGAYVMYAAEYKNGDPTTIHSARLQVIRVDDNAKAIRVSFVPLRDPKSFFANAETLEPNLDKLKNLTEADIIRFKPGCDLLLRFDGTAFTGGMAARACNRGPEMYFEYAMSLSAKGYWFREQARRVDDNSVGWEQAPGSNFTDFEMRRALPASCIATLQPGRIGNASTPQQAKLQLHSEGGTGRLSFPGAPPLELEIHSDPTSGYVLSLIDSATQLPTASSIGPGGAEPLKIDFEPFISVSCLVG